MTCFVLLGIDFGLLTIHLLLLKDDVVFLNVHHLFLSVHFVLLTIDFVLLGIHVVLLTLDLALLTIDFVLLELLLLKVGRLCVAGTFFIIFKKPCLYCTLIKLSNEHFQNQLKSICLFSANFYSNDSYWNCNT